MEERSARKRQLNRGADVSSIDDLASYRRVLEGIRAAWPRFLTRRQERLEQQKRHGHAAERVAENILEDLFTQVLDWELGDLNNQVGYADLLLSRLGIKYLLIETKRPGALAWNRRAVEKALDQAMRYAAEQRVNRVAVSDGFMLYAADVRHGQLKDRVFVSLEDAHPQEALWWLSLHGIYRSREDAGEAALRLLPEPGVEEPDAAYRQEEALLHPRYKVPARCFAYVGDASDTSTWKLPYRLANGDCDVRRLPKAIGAILNNYRGTKVSSVPEEAIPDVLVALGRAARSIGRMPGQVGRPAATYVQLEQVLRQLDRLDELEDHYVPDA